MMRVCSFLRFPGSPCAKAIRDMRARPDLLGDPGVGGHGDRRAGRPLTAEDLKAALVDGRSDLDGHRRGHRALAGEAIAFADQPLAELELVRDGGRRCYARDELDPA